MTGLPDVDTLDEWTPVPPKFPDHWLKVSFDDVFNVIATTDKKIPQKKYLKTGIWPVIDQGTSFVGGYTDDKTKIINVDAPLLVFGDHTRCMKFVRSDFAPGADGTKILAVTAQLDPKFYYHLYFAIKLPDRGYSRHFGFLKRCVFPIAPLNEQRRIVEKIEAMFDEIDKGVESLHTARTTLGLYRQSLLKSAFEGRLTADWGAKNADKLEAPKTLLARIQHERDTRYKTALDAWQDALAKWRADDEKGKKPAKPKRPPEVTFATLEQTKDLSELPIGWSYFTVGSLCEVVRGGSPRPAGDKRYHDGDIPFLKVADLTRPKGQFVRQFTYTIKEAGLSKTRLVEPETLMISNSGATLGVPKICKIEATFNDGIAAFLGLAPDENAFHYWFWVRMTPVLRLINQGAAQPNLNTTLLAETVIPQCSSAEQAEIVRRLDAQLEAADALEAEIDAALTRADALRQSILKKAFSGHFVPQDPNDEPASALLERIKTDRVKAPKKTRKKAPA